MASFIEVIILTAFHQEFKFFLLVFLNIFNLSTQLVMTSLMNEFELKKHFLNFFSDSTASSFLQPTETMRTESRLLSSTAKSCSTCATIICTAAATRLPTARLPTAEQVQPMRRQKRAGHQRTNQEPGLRRWKLGVR